MRRVLGYFSQKAVGKEIVAEITHLATTMPTDIAQRLLIALLSDAVIERLRIVATDHDLQAPITKTIQDRHRRRLRCASIGDHLAKTGETACTLVTLGKRSDAQYTIL